MKKTRRTANGRAAFVAVCTLFLGACSAAIDPLDVTLVNLEITDVTVFETQAVFTVRLANPNREPLVVDGSVYNLYINGVRVGKGLSGETFEIPRLGFATEEIQAALSNIAMATRIRSVLESRSFDYRLRGKVWVKTDFGTRKVAIDRSGFFEFDGDQATPENGLSLDSSLDGVGDGGSTLR